MVPPQRYESEQDEEMKSRESTRSKSREFTRSDRTTPRGATPGQVNSKSSQVPHQRLSEGAAIQQRPGASTSATPPAPPYALPSIIKFLFLSMLYARSEAPGVIADVALAVWKAVPSAWAIASILSQDLWDATEGARNHLLSDLARRQDPWDVIKGAGGVLGGAVATALDAVGAAAPAPMLATACGAPSPCHSPDRTPPSTPRPSSGGPPSAPAKPGNPAPSNPKPGNKKAVSPTTSAPAGAVTGSTAAAGATAATSERSHGVADQLGHLLSDLARSATVSLLCLMPTPSGYAFGASPV